MKLFLILLALLLRLPQDPAPAHPPPPVFRSLASEERQAFLDRMKETLATITTLEADFVQERHISLFKEPLVARGVCYYQTPGTLRWELTEPYVSILVLKDGKVAKFDRVDGRLRKMNPGTEDLLREVLGQIVEWIKGDFSHAEEMYRLEFQKASDYRIVMKPRSPELRKLIAAIELTIDSKTYRATRVVIREPGEDFLEIRFEAEKLGEKLEPALFDLESPALPD